MAITIVAHVSKKIPIPGVDYASQHASFSITGEIVDIDACELEAAQLFAMAESAVDQQLRLRAVPAGDSEQMLAPSLSLASTSGRNAPGEAQTRGSSAAIPRRPLPSTTAQRRYIERLTKEVGADPALICHEWGIDSLSRLSCTQAANLIDDLKRRRMAPR